MRHLCTRDTCDACHVNRATIENDAMVFLCAGCAETICGFSVTPTGFESGVNATTDSAPTPLDCASPVSAVAAFSVSSPALATGMSRGQANAGGEYEDVTALDPHEESFDAPTAHETTSLTVVGGAVPTLDVKAVPPFDLSDDDGIPAFLRRDKNNEASFTLARSAMAPADNSFSKAGA